MEVGVRHDIEQQIARAAVKSLTSAGYKISVFDGEAYALAKTDDASAILDAMFCTDGDVLYVYTPPAANNGSRTYRVCRVRLRKQWLGCYF